MVVKFALLYVCVLVFSFEKNVTRLITGQLFVWQGEDLKDLVLELKK